MTNKSFFVTNSAAPIQKSPFVREKFTSPATRQPTSNRQSTESENDEDEEENEDDSKSPSTQNKRLKRYIPKEFRKKDWFKGVGRRQRRFVSKIRCDAGLLTGCLGISRAFLIITSILIIIILLTCGHNCFSKKRETSRQKADGGTAAPREEGARQYDGSCIEIHFSLFVCVITLLFVTAIQLCYVLHVVEALPSCPWLAFECIFYATWAVLFIFSAILLIMRGSGDKNGGWWLVAMVSAFLDAIVCISLGLSRYLRFRRGDPAQDHSDDPDEQAHSSSRFERRSPRGTTPTKHLDSQSI